ELFAGSGYHRTGSGEAEAFLETFEVTTDDKGIAVFDVPYTPVPGKPTITATATDPDGNTSEVSARKRDPTLALPDPQTTLSRDARLPFGASFGDSIRVSDPDREPFPAHLTITVSEGALRLGGTAGLVGSGDGTASLSYSGTPQALNAALEALRFTPPHGF